MSSDGNPSRPAGHSRRGFMAKLTFGFLALAGAGLLFKDLFPPSGAGARSSSDNEFPGPDSIFHPAQDPRQDPRRKI